MMRTRILVTGVLLLMLSASAAYAQKVEADLVDGHPVINCEGMSSSAYTTTAKGSTEAELKTTAANKTVYKRFAVHKSDNSSSSNWSTAFTHCSGVSDGGNWRLPTQRELLLMWVLKSALEKASGFTSFAATQYWNATASTMTTTNSFFVHFNDGTISSVSKSTSYRVRCIKEI